MISLPPRVAPTDTPIFSAYGHAIEEDSVFAQVDMGTGHSRSRRRWTVPERVVSVQWILEADEMAAVDAWYENDLIAGSLPFAAKVRSEEEGDALVYWWARWITYQTEMLHLGRGRVSGTLLLRGEASDAPPSDHSASGALAASPAVVAGAAADLSFHLSTGALICGSAAVSGSTVVNHSSIGALVAGSAEVSGSATKAALHSSSGDIAAAAAAVSGASTLTPGDQHFASVVLLVDASTYADGTTPSTLDVIGKTPTYRNNAQVDTAQFIFGSSSLYFDGTNDRISFADSADFDFGSGDFTVEAFIRPEGSFSGAERYAIGQAATTGGFYSVLLRRNASNNFQAGVTNGTTPYESASGGTLASDTWRHVCISRVGNTLYLGNNGTLNTTVGLTGVTLMNSTGAFTLGGYADADHATNWRGWIDQVRVTKGVGRYSGSSYTVPSVKFPHS